ncbi:16S rRNA processing protein RimM [Roseobacter sp. HKCCD9010]|uniref:ribosome maturation factor RimM n=1 Tax=unclassified Roseobacter TaxID=196798 RepID=UPI001492BFC5|nr:MULTISPECIES: ribosome maturation factor RimM [unclassified Roseobacter]MBF9048955.1 16S rRNA processing protein RimM [Rhodobacterales bacterium HKCCD4356]NNV10954.1 16S rRNA processing protein RimM [Roseobacter sp. HKCCD7357]NNV15139.1 16S rRNA processing protein RimM [Roseobacter sp. HKCCD8768]NNV24598.1 16S rRNA processing protein RimM [Roseobacter sp. HKCCD8192]NNV28855.1 16S rRNA processing protein RimM [Roseobacter sp. HKCCD9061]
MSDRICVGAITGSFGVKGEARVKSFCAEPDAMGDYGPLSTEDGSRNFTLKITRAVKNGFAARLSGVTTKEQADALKGTRLYAPRDALPALPDDEFYHTDLIGLAVVDTGGQDRGRVHAVHNHGASDLLEVRAKEQKNTVLVPFTQEVVPTVDLTAKRIIIDPPEGLFDGG